MQNEPTPIDAPGLEVVRRWWKKWEQTPVAKKPAISTVESFTPSLIALIDQQAARIAELEAEQRRLNGAVSVLSERVVMPAKA